MTVKKPVFSLLLILSLLISGWVAPLAPSSSVLAAALPVVDDFEAGLPSGRDANNNAIGFNTFQDGNTSTTVAISTTDAPPAPVPGADSPNTVLQLDLSVVSYAGFTHTFENDAVDTWVTQDWSEYEGISFWLYGNNSGTTLFVDVLDNRNPGSVKDDAERWSIDIPDNFSGWQEILLPFATLNRKEIGNGAPNDGFGLTEVTGWALGSITTSSPQTYYVDNVTLYGTAPVRPLTVGFSTIDYRVTEGASATVTARLSKPSDDPVTVDYATTLSTAVLDRDYLPVMGTLTFPPNVTQQSFTIVTIDDQKHQGERGVLVELSNPTGGATLGTPPIARVNILDNDPYDPALLDDFETFPYRWSVDPKAVLSIPEFAAGDSMALPGQGAYEHVLQAVQKKGDGAYTFGRTFPVGQDWSDFGGISFWYYGKNNNLETEVTITNNQANVADLSQWKLVWSDEFDGKQMTAPNTAVWGREIGDGTVNGIPGWGNSELEYYTDGTENAVTDGKGNLQITVKEADGSLMCYYGPCEYTSARLLTKNRFEVAYGRVEARVKVPRGAGLWPAFWMLGTDIDQVGWPQTGEIDIMEYVGRQPNQIFGTLHGPGYSGGQSYGGYFDLGKPVADDFHVFAIEWQPDRIVWYLDGLEYFSATPNDAFMQGKQWVFNHPFFLLLNVAVGGNFGGAVGPDTTFPQTTLVDYVRLYQAKPQTTAYRALFRDDFTGWKQISIPFSAFVGPEDKPLDLSAVQSIQMKIPGGTRGPVLLDQVRVNCASEMIVTNANDSGPGSLRKALGSVCVNGTVTFDPAMAGQTVTLLSGPLTLGKNVQIDGSAAPGLTISGNNSDRVFIVNAGVTASISNLTIANGYGWQLAGGILNNGSLTLDHTIVTQNSMATDAGDWWQGGGAIYNGEGATFNLIDSTVKDNQAGWSGGGIYSFFNTTNNIVRSTISGNTANDVGGGIRSLGNFTITDSTISGNRSMGWHGGAIFHTDGDMSVSYTTVVGNIAPDWAQSAIFVASFNPAVVPSFTINNSIVASNQWYSCDHWTGAVNFSSGGYNLFGDDSCAPTATDLILSDPQVGALADNGGPTWTHALLPGSPALNAADNAVCSATDQRGIARPQGAQCDIGAFELVIP
jgi:beta-glucanase (GH16 family)